MRTGTVAFLIGIVIFQQFSVLPDLKWAGLLLLLVLVSLWLLRLRSIPASLPFAFNASLCFASLRLFTFCSIGFLWAWLYVSFIHSSTLKPELEGKDLIAEGMIVSVPVHKEHGIRFRFRIDHLFYEEKEVESPGQVRLNWYGNPADLRAGDQWRVNIRLKRPAGFMNPGSFDYEGWLFQQKIAATGYVRKNPEANRLLNPGSFSLNHQPIHYVRQLIAEKINKLSSDLKNTSIITALTIGERSQISAAQWEVLTKTGTNHLLAISGLHIGLISGLFFFLIRRVWSLSIRLTLYWPAPKAAAVAALLGALTYAALAGFSIPTQRALVMVAVVMGSILLDRASLPGRSLALALLLILLLDPLSVLSVGFWLSFAAVAVILYGMTGRIDNKTSKPSKLWHQWGKIQWLVLIGLLPLTLLFFQRVSIFAPIANQPTMPACDSSLRQSSQDRLHCLTLHYLPVTCLHRRQLVPGRDGH